MILILEKEGLVVFDFVVVGLFGAIFGSFLAMLVYRLPLSISLIDPARSFCPICKHSLRWYENIPLLSYIFLRGKCKECNSSISFVYFLVELSSVVVTMGLCFKYGFSLEFIFLSVIFYICIVLAFIDMQYKFVPDYLLVGLVLVSLFYIYMFKLQNISVFFIFAGAIFILNFFVTFYIQNIKAKLTNDINLKEQTALGEGDIPVIATMGGILGVKFGIVALGLSSILAIIPSLINKKFKDDIETPFIPFLVLAFFIVLVVY